MAAAGDATPVRIVRRPGPAHLRRSSLEACHGADRGRGEFGDLASVVGRGRAVWIDAALRQRNYSSSLNLLPTSSASAATAASASAPVAETVMVVPGPAESIISPMIEVPPTVSPPRVTVISASK